MKVLLLGAGASRAYTASWSGVNMPLANDFFRVFTSIRAAQHPWVMSGDVINYIRDTRGLRPERFTEADFNIEEVHSEIQEAFLAALNSNDERAQLDRLHLHKVSTQLTFLFAYVVNEVQNGPVSVAHQRLASTLNDDDVVITFNWDTLLDRALAGTGKWNTDTGYGIRPRSILRGTWTAPSNGERHGPILLKLHGSTNWITSISAFEETGTKIQLIQLASPDTVFVYEYATPPYDTYAGRYMVGFGPFSFGYYPPNIPDEGKRAPEGKTILRMRYKFPWMPEGGADDKGLTSISLIIPPVKRKEYDYYGELFTTLWSQAEVALVAADKITIVGYSFPTTDTQSQSLFRNAMKKRKSYPRIKVINPAPEQTVSVLHGLCGVPMEKIVVERSFFTSDFDECAIFN
jgi:hypothetical protein